MNLWQKIKKRLEKPQGETHTYVYEYTFTDRDALNRLKEAMKKAPYPSFNDRETKKLAMLDALIERELDELTEELEE